MPRTPLSLLVPLSLLSLLLASTTGLVTAQGAPVASASQEAPKVGGKVRLVVKPVVSSSKAPEAKIVVRLKKRSTAGRVVVRNASRTIVRQRVQAGRRMKVNLTLPVLGPGAHRLTAVYRGTSPRVRLTSAPVDVTSVAGCAPQPSICGYPDASNTGPDPATVLRAVPGDVRQGQGWHWDDRGWVMVDGEGAVFSGFSVQAGVVVEANNATISNSVIDVGNEGWGVSLRNSNGVVISNNVIRGPSADQPCDNGIRDIYGNADGVQILANEIHLCASAINHFNQGGVIRGNYIHELGHECVSGDVDCGHFNGIQLGAGDGPTMTIDHNTIFNPAPATDAVMLANDDGPQTNRVITDNLLAGGGYTFYGSGGPEGEASNIVFKDNRFSTIFFAKGGSLGPVAHWQEGFGNEWSGNVWEDGPSAGKPVYP